MAKDVDIKLTEHFRLSEFFNDNHEPLLKCEVLCSYYSCLRNIILNSKDLKDACPVAKNIICIAVILEKVRQDNPNIPFFISSGYRTQQVNNYCKGSARSYHLFGAACDFSFNGYLRYMKPFKNGHTPVAVTMICDDLKRLQNNGVLSELIFHDTYIHIALNLNKINEFLPNSLTLKFL